MVLFLNCDFLLFAFSFIHTFPSSFFLLHFVHHTRIPIISTSSPFFFSLLPLYSRSSLTLSFSSSLIFLSLSLFFFFPFPTWFHKFSSSLCDMSHIILLAFWCHYLQTHRHAWRERRNHICSTTPPPLLLLLTTECMQPRVISASIFFPCSWLVVVSDFRFVRSASIFFFLDLYCCSNFFSILDLLLLLFLF